MIVKINARMAVKIISLAISAFITYGDILKRTRAVGTCLYHGPAFAHLMRLFPMPGRFSGFRSSKVGSEPTGLMKLHLS